MLDLSLLTLESLFITVKLVGTNCYLPSNRSFQIIEWWLITPESPLITFDLLVTVALLLVTVKPLDKTLKLLVANCRIVIYNYWTTTCGTTPYNCQTTYNSLSVY